MNHSNEAQPVSSSNGAYGPALAQNPTPVLAIEYLPVDVLLPYPTNPRGHTKRQIKQVARSIEKFSCVMPILTNGNRSVIAGHAVLQACQLLKMATVPTIKVEHLTPEQEIALRISDGYYGPWAGFFRYIKRELEVSQGKVVPMVCLRSPDGSWMTVITITGKRLSTDNDGIIEMSEEDALPLLRNGWTRI